MSEKPYNPLEHSIVQALIRNEPTESFEATDFHEALLFAIAREIGRVHHNRYQTSWDRWSDDPHIPGIQWRRYAYGCDCPETSDGFIPKHLETCPLLTPNFGFEDIRFSWYKNPGRGMSINKEWPPARWLAWFNRCLDKIREFDPPCAGSSDHTMAPMPEADHFYEAACSFCLASTMADDAVQRELEAVRLAAEKGQREISTETGAEERENPWLLELDLTPREVKLVMLGIRAEKHRASRNDRPVAR